MSKIIAKVNGSPVSYTDYENAIQGYAMEIHRKTMEHLSADELKQIQEVALEKILARELIFQEALSQGIVADENLIQEEIGKIAANFPSEEEFNATLEKAGIDTQTYHRMIRQDLTVGLMTKKKLDEVQEPSDETVDAVYAQYPDKMLKPERVRACHILVKATEENREEAVAKIEEIKGKLGEEKFSVLAKLNSDCPSAAQGGDLGFFTRGAMVKPFEDAAFSQEVGEVGDVVETPFGFHLIQVLEKEEPSQLPLEEARPKIRHFLKNEAGTKLLEKWTAELKEAAEIEIASE